MTDSTHHAFKIVGFLQGYRVVGGGTWYGDFDRVADAAIACDLLNAGWRGSNAELRAIAMETRRAETPQSGSVAKP